MKFTIAVRHWSRPSRPALADLAGIPDPSVRRLALVALNRLLDAELADVYHPIGAPFWNVWLSHRLLPAMRSTVRGQPARWRCSMSTNIEPRRRMQIPFFSRLFTERQGAGSARIALVRILGSRQGQRCPCQ